MYNTKDGPSDLGSTHHPWLGDALFRGDLEECLIPEQKSKLWVSSLETTHLGTGLYCMYCVSQKICLYPLFEDEHPF